MPKRGIITPEQAIPDDWSFDQDFHAQGTANQRAEFAALAKLTGYRKPKTASGSTACYFFTYLQRKRKTLQYAKRRGKRN